MLTIPDSLAADLRDYFLTAQPLTPPLAASSIRLKLAAEEMPSPRLVIIPGEPRLVPQMPCTARVPCSLEYITSLDRVPAASHRDAAGQIEAWLRDIRTARRRQPLFSRVFLHDIFSITSILSIRQAEREQVTTIRCEPVITLCAPI